ncbi:hypothetical protein NKH85_11570 [Mesorhizobium sp. M0924]|uniref:hypothetical protein n=1 Tax=unclassified Mesorhizobium TaxID=325217 RepID=UPI003337D0A2
MTFADKCKLLTKRQGRRMVPAATDIKLRAALLPGAEPRCAKQRTWLIKQPCWLGPES